MAKLTIGEIQIGVQLPEIENQEVEIKTSEEVEVAILTQNALHEECACLDKKITQLREDCEDNLSYLKNSIEQDIEQILEKLNKKEEVIKPEVQVKTLVVDKSKEFKDELYALEDSLRLNTNSLFSKLDNKIDNDINNLKKRNKVLTICLALITILAIIK